MARKRVENREGSLGFPGFVKPVFTKDSKPPREKEKIPRAPRERETRTHLKKTNIACNFSIDTSGRNKCLPEIFYNVATYAYIIVDYEYACPTSKRSISRGILTTVTGHWKRTAANRRDKTNFIT
ncbi:hypothetical protein TNCV_3211641 [Trichonephila clavipes]|uniref:Uncharacterized protein n=1 Tax=Trichonephila clavipes TaxID=2585209 RepID=A0A8X6RX71_TRICX|nr:hypothetical protein TNCV_3211641 [Trichonephila clavipes]